ncbi:MAG: hypothetical protein CMA72_09850 [Euryarchaeota archaeon]|nr:hypothetical protein [Euryarchaeota archaeon]
MPTGEQRSAMTTRRSYHNHSASVYGLINYNELSGTSVMNWKQILDDGHIPDCPGRDAAVADAVQLSKQKASRKALPKARKASRPSRFPGLKHSVQN